jgi:hypothetical protein
LVERAREALITWRAPELLSHASKGKHSGSPGPRKPEHEVQVWYEQIEMSEPDHAFSIRLQWGKMFKNDLTAVLASRWRPAKRSAISPRRDPQLLTGPGRCTRFE